MIEQTGGTIPPGNTNGPHASSPYTNGVASGDHSGPLLLTTADGATSAAHLGVISLAPVSPSSTLNVAAAHFLEWCAVQSELGYLSPHTVVNRRQGVRLFGELGSLQLQDLKRSRVRCLVRALEFWLADRPEIGGGR